MFHLKLQINAFYFVVQIAIAKEKRKTEKTFNAINKDL